MKNLYILLLTTFIFSTNLSFGQFGPQKIITDSLNAICVFPSDLDGDLDILSASQDSDIVVWFENIDGFGSFSTQKLITNLTNCPERVTASDIDGDGDNDVISASRMDGKIAWYENIDGYGTFGPQQIISNLSGGNLVVACDIDNDGDMDVIADGGQLFWH